MSRPIWKCLLRVAPKNYDLSILKGIYCICRTPVFRFHEMSRLHYVPLETQFCRLLVLAKKKLILLKSDYCKDLEN